MKNIFEEPYIEVLKFSVLDVLTASPDLVTDGGGEVTDVPWEE